MVGDKQSQQFYDNLLFPKLFQTFRIAIHHSNLIIAFLGVVIIFASGRLMDLNKTVVVSRDNQGKIIQTELQKYIENSDQVKSYIEKSKDNGQRIGVFSTLWQFAAERFQGAVDSLFAFDLHGVVENIANYFRSVRWALKYHFVYCIIFFAIKLAVISVTGGAICRLAALQFSRGEKPGPTEAIRFSTKRFMSFFTAPLAPLCIIATLGLLIFIIGLLGNIPHAGEWIVGIFMLFSLIVGTLITIVVIGTFAGFNLMFPAVAYDGPDCFDAISRSFSYVYNKPWRMLFYSSISLVYGAICYIFVRFFAFLLLWVTQRFLQLGIWIENSEGINKLSAIWSEPSFMKLSGAPLPPATTFSEAAGALLVQLSLWVVLGLIIAVIVSFYFSANTIIYSLMRKKVDNTALDDIYTHFEDEITEPTITEPKAEEAQSKSEPEVSSEK